MLHGTLFKVCESADERRFLLALSAQIYFPVGTTFGSANYVVIVDQYLGTSRLGGHS